MTSASSWERVRPVRTHEQVLAQIQAKILGGELRAGEKLPSERELVEALGVSRTSVREALRVLEALGIIDANTGSGKDAGSIVTGRSTAALGNLLRLHMAVTRIDLSDLIEIRCQLEQNAAAGAAVQATGDEVAHLRALIANMRADDVEEEQFNELDTEFHVSIARASRNVLAADLMQALRDAVKSEMTAAFDRLPDWQLVTSTLIEEHERITDAIEQGEGDRAGVLVHQHITGFYNDQLRK